jgi:hypothetical protein
VTVAKEAASALEEMAVAMGRTVGNQAIVERLVV